MATHWLNQRAQSLLDSHNQNNNTNFTTVSAHIFVFRDGKEFLVTEANPIQGRYSIPAYTLPNVKSIRNEIIDKLADPLTAATLETVQFMDYWIPQPLSTQQQDASSELRLLILVSIVNAMSEDGGIYVSTNDAVGGYVAGEGQGVTSAEVTAAVCNLRWTCQKNFIFAHRNSADIDEACTKTLAAIIAATCVASGKRVSETLGCIMDMDDQNIGHTLILYRTTLEKLPGLTEIPSDCPAAPHGAKFRSFGQWRGSMVQWTVDEQRRQSWWRQVMSLRGRLDAVYL